MARVKCGRYPADSAPSAVEALRKHGGPLAGSGIGGGAQPDALPDGRWQHLDDGAGAGDAGALGVAATTWRMPARPQTVTLMKTAEHFGICVESVRTAGVARHPAGDPDHAGRSLARSRRSALV